MCLTSLYISIRCRLTKTLRIDPEPIYTQGLTNTVMEATTYKELEDSLNELDESPLGKIEFGADVFPEDKEVHIRHFKVDSEYRGQGAGSEVLSEALDIIKESNVDIQQVGINLLEKGGSYEFLESFGFEDVTIHNEGDEQIAAGILYL